MKDDNLLLYEVWPRMLCLAFFLVCVVRMTQLASYHIWYQIPVSQRDTSKIL